MLVEPLLNELLNPKCLLKINACLVLHGDKILCTYRCNHLYSYNSYTHLTNFDYNFNPIAHRLLVTEDGNTALEDVRLFSFKNTLLAFYTFLPKVREAEWNWEYTVGVGIVDLEEGKITNQKSLRKYSNQKHEKNWVPYDYMGELFVITNFQPYVRILKLRGDIKDFEFKEVYLKKNEHLDWSWGAIRGGTPLFSIPKNKRKDSDINFMYGFIHSSLAVSDNGEVGGFYFYSLIRFDPNNYDCFIQPTPTGYSDNEYDREYNRKHILTTGGKKLKVVFPMGVILYDEGVLMSFGKDDCESRTRFFNWDFIQNWFNEQPEKLELIAL